MTKVCVKKRLELWRVAGSKEIFALQHVSLEFPPGDEREIARRVLRIDPNDSTERYHVGSRLAADRGMGFPKQLEQFSPEFMLAGFSAPSDHFERDTGID